MMRKIGYFLTLLTIVSLIAWLSPLRWIDHAYQTIEKLRQQQDTDDTYAGKTYILPETGFLQFPLSGVALALKLSSNAAIHNSQITPDLRVHYAIHYQLVAADNTLLIDDIYHHRSTLPSPLATDDGTRKFPLFFIDPTHIPAIPQPQHIQSPLLASAAYLRLRLAKKDSAITDVGVRVALQPLQPDSILSYQWQRLSQDKKQQFAKAHIYGVRQLTREEKHQLLRTESSPLGPDGNEGEEYHSRKLYHMNKQQRLTYANTSEPEGRLIDNHRLATLTLKQAPDNASEMTVELRFNSTTGFTEHPVTVTWYAANGRDNQQFTLYPTEAENRFRKTLLPGVLEITSQTPLYLSATSISADPTVKPVDLLAGTRFIRAWQLSDKPLTYSVITDTGKQENDTLRLDIRHKHQAEDSKALLAQYPITYQWLDKAHNPITTGTLYPDNTHGLYDRLYDDNSPVSDASPFYLRIPPRADHLALTGNNQQLVTFYTRPSGLIKRIQIPSPDQFHHAPLPIQPSWFLSRPDHWQHLIVDQRSQLIALQKRPRILDEAIRSGTFQWQAARPINATSRDILVPGQNNGPTRKTAISTTFYRLHPPVNTQLQFDATDARQQIQATLLYERDTNNAVDIQITLNGEVKKRGLTSTQGAIALPATAQGTHHLAIEAPEGVRWYLNYLKPASSDTDNRFQRREVFRLDASPLEIPFTKHSDDKALLLLQFFPDAVPHTDSVRPTMANEQANTHTPIAVLRSDIQLENTPQPEISTGQTLASREFTLTNAPSSTVEAEQAQTTWPVFSTQGGRVGHSKRLFIPFDTDLPAGEYRVRLSRLSGRSGYITAYSITPGEYQQQRFFKEAL